MFNKDTAKKNDARLLALAKYIETNGTTRHIRDAEVIFKRFGYLKCLLRNGTFGNIDELEESVYKIFGIVDKDLDFNENAAIIDLIKRADKDLEEHESKDCH